eukprot:Lankesteria_metandrocarpae@DN7136_c0_g1_i1.p1
MQNTSSAFFLPVSAPALSASIHQLSDAEISEISLSRLEFFPLSAVSPEIVTQIKDLHNEWFPVMYDSAFYNALLTGKLFSIGAFYRRFRGSRRRGASIIPRGDDADASGSKSPVATPRHLIPAITSLSSDGGGDCGDRGGDR